jgi:2,5-dichlorohydroquinone reductive dechlorinase
LEENEIMAMDVTIQHQALQRRFPGVPVDVASGLEKPAHMYHLYHAPASICSQKVRAVLAQTGQSYISHQFDIPQGDSYEPEYVRIRLRGCQEAGIPLSRAHLGSTSATRTGCDACVVPTLVTGDEKEVLVDSVRICLEIDRRNEAAPEALRPADLAMEIDEQLSIVDDISNYQFLPVVVAAAGASGKANSAFASAKVARCERLLAEHAGDAELILAYSAKRDKERVAAESLFDDEALQKAECNIVVSLQNLETKLAGNKGRYIFGDRVTLADLFWGVELVRLHDTGFDRYWVDGKMPFVARYHDNLCKEAAIAHAVLDWPGARRAHHIA